MVSTQWTKIPRVAEADRDSRETLSTRLIHSITQASPEAGISTVSPDRNELIFVPHLSAFLHIPVYQPTFPLPFSFLFSLQSSAFHSYIKHDYQLERKINCDSQYSPRENVFTDIVLKEQSMR